MTAFEMAKKYYPKYWNLIRLQMLLQKGKLTQEEYDEIVKGENNDSNQNQTESAA